jgi:arginine/lysine/ornithine decarboxylase
MTRGTLSHVPDVHGRSAARLSVTVASALLLRQGLDAAEQITPYPPGIPVLVPGERINAEVLEYLRSGLAAGMVLPDPTDPSLQTIRVTAHAAARPWTNV